ncbi:hypothetical protein H257_14776 [Aphanomyces astaci]|uniref:Uncharacterized protein n=1 Tax=Aphanomyces astaci TaxID=112090 RepID=W4FQ02_APHAT|nr:hypothetical protein H257_14776 [Aphanomyces astaci]ETV69540.1 hypothetical protein H257_14776 [Aphanomyces astaci]|eukprot:XP_009840964.1 hypothetical protein H257_14776 [Aphanomyces astaci]
MTTELDAAIAFVAKARPKALTVGEKLDIIRLQAYFRKSGIKDVSNHVATILGRSNKTIQTVWSQVPGTQAVLTLVLDFVRAKWLTHSRVDARDAMELLCEHGHLDLLRAAQRRGTSLGLKSSPAGQDSRRTTNAMFTHDFFVDWFTDLLDEVESMNLHGVIFAMDNSKYHKGLPDGTPKATWKKAQLLDACQRLGLGVMARERVSRCDCGVHDPAETAKPDEALIDPLTFLKTGLPFPFWLDLPDLIYLPKSMTRTVIRVSKIYQDGDPSTINR